MPTSKTDGSVTLSKQITLPPNELDVGGKKREFSQMSLLGCEMSSGSCGTNGVSFGRNCGTESTGVATGAKGSCLSKAGDSGLMMVS